MSKKSKFLSEFSVKLREVRVASGIRQKEVVEKSLGVLNSSLVSTYELGTEPTLTKFIALCIALGKHPFDLLPKDVVRMIEGRVKKTDADYFKRSPA